MYSLWGEYPCISLLFVHFEPSNELLTFTTLPKSYSLLGIGDGNGCVVSGHNLLTTESAHHAPT